jgi:glycerol kinase
MGNEKFILSLDQGTTSCRALIIDREGNIKGVAQKEFTQYYPKPGWVEHDANEILRVQLEMIYKVMKDLQITPDEIGAIGITNQRETAVIWDRETGQPIYPAIVWQDRRTASICEDLKARGLAELIADKTGLVIDAYFSATKIKWILNHVSGAREKAERGQLCFGTMDSWLIWHLTDGSAHVTDYSNASRTMLFNIQSGEWDAGLCKELDIPLSLLPDVRNSCDIFGTYVVDGTSIPIAGVAGDQQAALFGQQCIQPGDTKNTYGTGCFLLMQTGPDRPLSSNGLLTTIAWGIDGILSYALEGSIFIAGAAVQWLRDGLKIIQSASETEKLAHAAKPDHEVVVVPAFAGLGAPYWDMYARGAVFGLTRDVRIEEIVEATLRSLAFQTKDIIEAMQEDSGIQLSKLKVDGGATANNYLMQFQSDILKAEVERPTVTESTAMGAAFLAGIGVDFWNLSDLQGIRMVDRIFKPSMSEEKRDILYMDWKKAVERSRKWINQ